MNLYFRIGSDEDDCVSCSGERCQSCAMREYTERFDGKFRCGFVGGKSEQFGLGRCGD